MENAFQKQFRQARKCSAPLVVIRSSDPIATQENAVQSLNGKQNEFCLLSWDVMRGILGLNELGKDAVASVLDGASPEQVSARPTDALSVAQKLPPNSILFLHNFHLFDRNESVIQSVLNLRDLFKASGSMLVPLAISGSTVAPELTEHTLVIDDPLPTLEELFAIVRKVFQDAGLPEPAPEIVSKACDAVRGLSAFAAEQSIALSLYRDGLNLSETWERKRKVIEQTPGLAIWQGTETFAELGGLDQFKSYVTAVFQGKDSPKCAVFMDEIEKAVAQDAGNSTKTEIIGLLLSWFADRKADGILLYGVPGAGKSQGVKALSREFGVPVISCNVAAMQDQFVGNSVKNLRKALSTIDAISSGKPIVFATCNKLDTLSPELRRRFKLGTFFFDLPNDQEQETIWKLYEAKYGVYRIVGEQIDYRGWTGAEIEECCSKAYRLNLSLLESAKYIVSVSKSASEQIKAMRLQASGKFLSATESGVYRFEDSAVAVTGRKFRE